MERMYHKINNVTQAYHFYEISLTTFTLTLSTDAQLLYVTVMNNIDDASIFSLQSEILTVIRKSRKRCATRLPVFNSFKKVLL